MHDNQFWLELEKLVEQHRIVIDRPRGSAHPHFTDFIYPLDYGYLEGTTTTDENEIDIWVGTENPKKIDAIMCTVDPIKKDIEVKILYGCTDEEKELIYAVHNRTMRGILIKR